MTRRAPLSFRLLALVVFVTSAVASCAPRNTAWIDEATVARIDRVYGGATHGAAPGFILGLVKEGRLVFVRAYGYADLGHDVRIGPQTAFHLASLSKQFTASAIALLVLRKKMSLDDPVAKYIPETAKYGPALRVKDFVFMTSGLHEYFDTKRANGDPWYSSYYFTRDEAIRAALKPDRLLFVPGSQYQYNNTNYMLLSKIVEKVSGEPFAVFMRREVFL